MSGSGPAEGGRGTERLPTPARDLALAALGDRAGNVTAHLNRLLSGEGISPVEAALARELAMGVVRRRRTLDAVISAFQQRREQRLGGKVRDILRLGVYQILFLQRVPDFAAVNEAVEQVGRRRPRSRGFVNALLRGVARSASPRQVGPVPLAPDVVSVDADSFRRLDRPVFADPGGDPAGFLAEAFSLPDELADRWLASFRGLAGAVRAALHANARPPLILRVNACRATVPEVLWRLSEAGVEAVPHVNGLSVVPKEHLDVRGLEVFAEGLIQPQDASATAVIAAADVQPGMRVLDMCAAPGTKTTHLAERMQNSGRIVACDVSPERLARIEENCQRMGLTIVQTVLAERVLPLTEQPFDLVLVDAPCSNTGVLARRAEARWRFSGQRLRKLSRDQRGLLHLAAQFVRSGGTLVYATCSLEPEENGQVVRDLTGREPTFRLLRQRQIRPAGADEPSRWLDGGYFAILRRS
jgi:16S rRNA (cytosine967-C5)-methyltransferase